MLTREPFGTDWNGCQSCSPCATSMSVTCRVPDQCLFEEWLAGEVVMMSNWAVYVKVPGNPGTSRNSALVALFTKHIEAQQSFRRPH